MCGENEVLAQVKLSFNNTNGERLICTRSLQLTVKNTARSVKTLDGTLTITKNGERSTLSTRCADLDLQMPLSLGVSAAVLEYVIFCHQEDSTWPLSEPSILKKRFDKIFEALKYTQALEQIKTVRKDQLVQVKIDSIELGHEKTNKERAAKTQTELESLLEQINMIRGRVASLQKQADEALVEQDQLFKSGEEFERIIAELDRSRHERHITKETLRDLSRNVTEYQESDEELREMQVNFARNMARHDETIEGLRKQSEVATVRMREAREELDQGMSREGQLRAEAEQYERHLIKRGDLIKNISKTHNILGFDMNLDDEQVADFHAKLSQMVKSQVSKLERTKHAGRSQEEEIEKDLQRLLQRKTELESLKSSARASMRSNERKISELQVQIERSTSSVAEMKALETSLKQAEDEILNARAELERKDWDRMIREKTAEIRFIEDRVENINIEISTGNRQADTRAKLGLIQGDLKKRQESLKTLVAANATSFTKITKKSLELRSMESDIRLAASGNMGELEDAEKAHEVRGKEVSQIEAQMDFTRQQLKRKRVEEIALRGQIAEVFDNPEAADEELAAIERELEKAHSNYYQAQYAVKFYERAAAFAEERDCCQLCHQRFHESFTLEEFRQLLTSKKAMVPKHLANAQERINSLTGDLENVKGVQPARASLAILSHEVPKLEEEVKEQQALLRNAVEASERALAKLQDVRAQSRAISVLETTASEIKKLQKEIADTSNQLVSLETELAASGSSRSVDEMQAELSRLQEDNRRVKKEIAQLTADRDNAKSNITSLDGKRRDIQLAQSEALGNLREKQNMQERIDECRESVDKSEQEILRAEAGISHDQPEIDRLREEFQSVKRTNAEAEDRTQREASRLTASQNSLTNIETDINSYLQRGGPEALRNSRNLIDSLRTKMKQAEDSIVLLTEEISSTEKKSQDIKGTERNIDDNLRLRKIRNDVARLDIAINDLESKNAERDRDQYIINSKRLRERYSRVMTERARLLGEMTQLDIQLKKKEKQLDTEFKDADEVYRKRLIKVRTMEKANEDLDKYGRALDSAIMKYHALKMGEINKIVDELWRSTYCGTDVDSISIQSEGEAKASNRSYNYRVCMIKGEAELDMRGRCSAGQKMLASIIIRLALAECFGVNCGILALDEPTTNLDRDNIESLAKSLANIISVRRSQKNFQLIVITHDEEFLRMMGCSDYCDYYYRVSRNEHQKSIIERQRVSVL